MRKAAPKQKIFNNDLATELAIQFKQTGDFVTYQKICAASNDLMDSIIRSNKFHLQVPFDDIKNFLFLQVENWLEKWTPDKGKIYSYFSTSTTGDTLLQMPDGSQEEIQSIIQRFRDGEEVWVQSWDFENQCMVKGKVIDFHMGPADRKEWRKITVTMPDGRHKRLFFTGEHEFPVLPTGGTEPIWKPIDDFTATDRVLWRGEKLLPYGQEAILGMYLGDAHIRSKWQHLIVGHGGPQRNYSEHIAEQLKTTTYGYTKKDGHIAVGLYKALSKIWPEAKQILPIGPKKLTAALLEHMTPVSLAYWFMDDGSLNTERYASLHTEGFREEERDLLIAMLQKKWGITATKRLRAAGYSSLYIPVEFTECFMELVAPHIIPSMQYKLPPKFRGRYEESEWLVESLHQCQVKVETTSGIGNNRQKTRYAAELPARRRSYTPNFNIKYDITVEKYRNFIVEGGAVVSNCIKHACLSVVSKETLFRQRFMLTDLPMEALSSATHAPKLDAELRQVLIDSLKEFVVRWREPVIQDIVRYLVCCVVNTQVDKRQSILRTITLGFPVDLNVAKFLLDWTQAAVRAALLEHYDQPLGEIDVIRASERFSFLPDIIALIGLENAKKLMVVFSGTTIRFPSQTHLRRHTMLKKIYRDLGKDPTPDNVTALSRKFRTTPEKIENLHELVSQNIQAGLVDDLPLYGDCSLAAEHMAGEVFDGAYANHHPQDDEEDS